MENTNETTMKDVKKEELKRKALIVLKYMAITFPAYGAGILTSIFVMKAKGNGADTTEVTE